MKKLVSLFLCLCLAVSCAAIAAAEGAAFVPGTYEGSGTGYSETTPVTVKVTVDENAITAVEIAGEGEQPFGVPQFDTYASALVGRADADIDAVANATMTRNGVKEAVEKALAAARGEEEADGEPVAFAGMWLIMDEAHVMNIAVRADRRGRGYGERITGALIQLAADSGMVLMTLECRRSNAAAQGLYHKLGFQDVGYRKGYYENGEDALIMYLQPLPEGHPENDPYLQREDGAEE